MLFYTNPSLEDYSIYAADQLVELATEEACEEKRLPLVFGLWIDDCPKLIASQRLVFLKVARQLSVRVDFGLFSIYKIKLTGQKLLPSLLLPDYTVTTFAGAGNFLTVLTRNESGISN